jgi:hypothetical protein
MGTPDYWNKDHARHRVYGKDYGIIGWKLVRAEEWKDNDKFLIFVLEKV